MFWPTACRLASEQWHCADKPLEGIGKYYSNEEIFGMIYEEGSDWSDVMKLYLLRHGDTDWSQEGRLQGHTDIPLNKKGIEQIKAVGEYFVHSKETIDVIITSPLIRAHKSAEIIAEKIGYPLADIIIEPGFIERSFGLGEGLTKEERRARFLGKGYPNAESVMCDYQSS